jgi:hypothetical protein
MSRRVKGPGDGKSTIMLGGDGVMQQLGRTSDKCVLAYDRKQGILEIPIDSYASPGTPASGGAVPFTRVLELESGQVEPAWKKFRTEDGYTSLPNGPLKAASSAITSGKIDLTTEVVGILPPANGGGGGSIVIPGTPLNNVLLLGDGTNLVGQSFPLPIEMGGTGSTIYNGDGPLTLSLGVIDTQTLPAIWGGTGKTSYTIGDLLYAPATDSVDAIADVAVGNALISGGVGLPPSYGKVGLSTHVSGTLPIANGGTGVATAFPAGDVISSNGTTLSSVADVAVGNALISGGVGLPPSYGKVGLTTHVSGTLPIANGGTGFDASGLVSNGIIVKNNSGTAYAQRQLSSASGMTFDYDTNVAQVAVNLPQLLDTAALPTFTSAITTDSAASNTTAAHVMLRSSAGGAGGWANGRLFHATSANDHSLILNGLDKTAAAVASAPAWTSLTDSFVGVVNASNTLKRIPSTSVVMTTGGSQTVTGIKTFGDGLRTNLAANQIWVQPPTGFGIVIDVKQPATSGYIYGVPDAGYNNASFVICQPLNSGTPFVSGDILYGNSDGKRMLRLPAGPVGSLLRSTGSGLAPAWETGAWGNWILGGTGVVFATTVLLTPWRVGNPVAPAIAADIWTALGTTQNITVSNGIFTIGVSGIYSIDFHCTATFGAGSIPNAAQFITTVVVGANTFTTTDQPSGYTGVMTLSTWHHNQTVAVTAGQTLTVTISEVAMTNTITVVSGNSCRIGIVKLCSA